MQKLLSLNIGSKGFRAQHDAACEAQGLPYEVIRSRNCCFVLENGTVTLVHKNVPLDPHEYGYLFIRVAGNYSLMTSLIGQYFTHHEVPISDCIYLDHTENEEKVTQMLALTLAQLPIPQTVLFTVKGLRANEEIIREAMSFPCVLKTNGSQGRNVWKVESWEEVLTHTAELTAEVAMLQAFVPNDSDLRVLYMHGDVIGGIERSATDGFLNNVSAGGTTTVAALSDAEITLAIQAAEALGRSFAGVDIVRTPEGPLLFEVNLGPQIYGYERTTHQDVPAELVARIKAQYFS